MNAAQIEPTAEPSAPIVGSEPEPEPVVIVTARAAKIMQGQLLKRGTPDAAIRFGIRGGGCTGYTYVFEFSDKPPRNGLRLSLVTAMMREHGFD